MCAQHPVTLPVKNGPEDNCVLVETCSPHIALCNNKYSHADVQFFSITVRILALRDAFIQKKNTGIWWGNLREREDLEDPGIGGKIILIWIFRKWDVGVWTGSSWLRRGTGGGHL